MKGGKKKEKSAVKTEEYEVDDIVAHKKERGLDFFKVRWKGFDESDDTWEVEANLAHAPMFHSKMQELRKETEQKIADREAEAAAQAHAKKRRRQTASESDPSRPCGVDGPAEESECEYRIYATGTKVPKNHLPDEIALGNRLSILRFKRSVPGVQGTSDQSQEEGHDITVTYTIDGTDTYTIPFNAARRYCCQRLLSYLIRRTTFRSPRGSQETAAEGTACTGRTPQQSADDGGSVQDPSPEQAESREEKLSSYGEAGADGTEELRCTNAGVNDAGKNSLYTGNIKELKENTSIVHAGAQSTSAPPATSELGLVDAA